MPKTSVIMSVFNGERFLRRSIESMLVQTTNDFELLVMDDGSKDGTGDLLKAMSDMDSRVRVFSSETNRGMAESLNALMDMAKGKYIARLDADDVAMSNRIENQVSAIERGFGMVASCYRVVDDQEKELYSHCPTHKAEMLKWSLVFRNNIRHSTVMWRKDIGQKYDQGFTYAQDYDMWCRMAKSQKIWIMPEITTNIRVHNDAITSTKRNEQEHFAAVTTAKQVEFYTGRKCSICESKDLRLLQYLKDSFQFGQLNEMDEERTKNSVCLYMEVLDGFIKKENPPKDDIREEVRSDISSLVAIEAKRKCTLEAIKAWSRNNFRKSAAKLISELLAQMDEI